MFLYCGASSVSIWSGTSNFYILGHLVFLPVQEIFRSSATGNIYSETIDKLLYDWEYLGMGLVGYT